MSDVIHRALHVGGNAPQRYSRIVSSNIAPPENTYKCILFGTGGQGLELVFFYVECAYVRLQPGALFIQLLNCV